MVWIILQHYDMKNLRSNFAIFSLSKENVFMKVEFRRIVHRQRRGHELCKLSYGEYSKNRSRVKAVNFCCKALHFWCLRGSWLRNWLGTPHRITPTIKLFPHPWEASSVKLKCGFSNAEWVWLVALKNN